MKKLAIALLLLTSVSAHADQFFGGGGGAAPTPAATSTPAPTATPIPPVATATPAPTVTPQPTATPQTIPTALTNSARVTKAASQTISNNTATAVIFDTETGTYFYDNGGFHDNVTNNTRLTVPATGKYDIGCQIAFTASATAYRTVYLRVGGTDYITEVQQMAISTASTDTSMIATTEVNLSATNYVECVVFQLSGGDLAIDQALRYPVFWATQIQ